MKKLKEFREKLGLSQSELAIRAGISQPSIGAIEAGKKSPTIRTLEKLAFALGISITELLDDSHPKASGE